MTEWIGLCRCAPLEGTGPYGGARRRVRLSRRKVVWPTPGKRPSFGSVGVDHTVRPMRGRGIFVGFAVIIDPCLLSVCIRDTGLTSGARLPPSLPALPRSLRGRWPTNGRRSYLFSDSADTGKYPARCHFLARLPRGVRRPNPRIGPPNASDRFGRLRGAYRSLAGSSRISREGHLPC